MTLQIIQNEIKLDNKTINLIPKKYSKKMTQLEEGAWLSVKSTSLESDKQ